jgi:GNAT superfamily N-acetyltransferase
MVSNNLETGLDTSIEKIDVIMVCNSISNLPNYKLNKNYNFRYYQKGDEECWADIQTKVRHFSNRNEAIIQFEQEFGKHLELLKERMLFVTDAQGNYVATATIWFSTLCGREIQRVHWVAVDPTKQGQRISHAMMTELLSKYSNRGPFYLTTQTWSYRAISIYMKFGFVPYPFSSIDYYFRDSEKAVKDEECNKKIEEAWEIVMEKIKSH